jgi:hypothetical protein
MDASKVRKRALPSGWYPAHKSEILELFEKWEAAVGESSTATAIAAIVPHAGWFFSGELAYRTLRRLDSECQTIVLIGGHLRPGDEILAARETEIESPFGGIPVDLELLARIEKQIEVGEDRVPDNTVEVHVPLVAGLFPKASLVWLRAGAGEEAIELGRVIAGIAGEMNKPVAVVGSTDLTHYGPNYGFTPHGTGREALEWSQKENDAGIIRRMLEMKPEEILEWGNTRQAACSSGAAAAAVEYAAEMNCREGILVGYDNSSRKSPGSSFVGYAGIIYPRSLS